MGLLTKTNPYATRASVIGYGLFGAAVGAGLFFAGSVKQPDWWDCWPILLSGHVIFCGALAAVQEWKMHKYALDPVWPEDECDNGGTKAAAQEPTGPRA